MGCFEISFPDTICYYYYKRPFDSLDNGLLQLKTDDDVYDMTKWVSSVREISLYGRHPTKEIVRRVVDIGCNYEVRGLLILVVTVKFRGLMMLIMMMKFRRLMMFIWIMKFRGLVMFIWILKFRGVYDVDMDAGVQGNDTVGGDNDVDVHDGVVGFSEARDVVESDRVDLGLDNMNDGGFTMDGVYDDFFNDEGPNLANGAC
ncbi:hypothetical protein LIER_31169 [Lithospermum erythrorhizon]|uniref:Uncharacterized protein n=1 Tax=Lithospermum erythrorhizon TaxID=34254 RepID=A0AAV3RSE2_LITER